MKRVVAKLGGSLLDLPDWPERFLQWLAAQGPVQCLVVVGCGSWGDEVRRWDEHHALGDAFCHQLCARLLSLTAETAGRVLSQRRDLPYRVVRVESIEAARALADQGDSARPRSLLLVLDAGVFLTRGASDSTQPFPENWSVTSDSIAAEAARCWQAEELALLKSRPPVDSLNWNDAAEQGLVDREFPRRIADLRSVTWTNLRASEGSR